MFAGLVMFAGLNTRLVISVKQCALACLCIGLGLGLCFFFKTTTDSAKLALLVGCTLLGASIVLQFNGIRAFRSQSSYGWQGLLFIALVFVQTAWFEFVQPSIANRSIANSLVFAAGYIACSFMLFKYIKPAVKTATYFTGIMFAVLALVLLARAVFIYQLPTAYTLYSNIPMNPNSLLLSCLLQLCITFGFLLMLNRELVSEIEHVAARDNLTGAFNRRELESELIRLQSRYERSGDYYSLMLIDIDNFKLINDNYGHLVGDEVLRRFARIVFASIRAEDYFARYGGDEFCILLPSTSVEDALSLANRLRLAYAKTPHIINDHAIQSSISIGVSESTSAGNDYNNMISAADKALYQAKDTGRNRVSVIM
jgi:diguanylate cyclase (GGDEF)-like protein